MKLWYYNLYSNAHRDLLYEWQIFNGYSVIRNTLQKGNQVFAIRKVPRNSGSSEFVRSCDRYIFNHFQSKRSRYSCFVPKAFLLTMITSFARVFRYESDHTLVNIRSPTFCIDPLLLFFLMTLPTWLKLLQTNSGQRAAGYLNILVHFVGLAHLLSLQRRGIKS